MWIAARLSNGPSQIWPIELFSGLDIFEILTKMDILLKKFNEPDVIDKNFGKHSTRARKRIAGKKR